MNGSPDPRDPRDPIEAWRDVSRRAAAGGYRPGRPVRAWSTLVASIGGLAAVGGLAVVAVIVVGGLALRGPAADPGGPIFAGAEDTNFRLTLTTPRGTYGTNDSIRPVATVTYLGPLAAETVFHATSPVGFRIEEIGGDRLMSGATRLPCRTTELARGEPGLYPLAKSGDTSSGFDEAWYRDPVLRLPAGTWRIVAMFHVGLGDCAAEAERHQLSVENVITVTADADDPVVATAEDANLRLTLTTPHGTYRPNEAVESIATVTYLGPLDSESLFHATSPILFHVEEVGGESDDGRVHGPSLPGHDVRSLRFGGLPVQKERGRVGPRRPVDRLRPRLVRRSDPSPARRAVEDPRRAGGVDRRL